MYKVTVFEHDQDTIMLQALAEHPCYIKVRDGVLLVEDTDNEFLIVPLGLIGHVSVVKDGDDA